MEAIGAQVAMRTTIVSTGVSQGPRDRDYVLQEVVESAFGRRTPAFVSRSIPTGLATVSV